MLTSLLTGRMIVFMIGLTITLLMSLVTKQKVTDTAKNGKPKLSAEEEEKRIADEAKRIADEEYAKRKADDDAMEEVRCYEEQMNRSDMDLTQKVRITDPFSDKLEIKKELDSGYFGTTFLVEDHVTHELYVIKRQKILPEQCKEDVADLPNKVWQEINAVQFISRLPFEERTHLMSGYNCAVRECGDFKHNSFQIGFPGEKEWQARFEQSKYCLDFAIEYKGGTNCRKLQEEKLLSTKETFYLFIQVCHAVNILRKYGWCHCDLHPGNIVAEEIKEGDKLLINGNVLQCRYKYSIVDYGTAIQKTESEERPGLYDFLTSSNSDMMRFVRGVLVGNKNIGRSPLLPEEDCKQIFHRIHDNDAIIDYCFKRVSEILEDESAN